MSNPDPKAELHELVSEFCLESQGEGMNIPYLHDEIDHPSKRTDLFREFMDWVEDLHPSL